MEEVLSKLYETAKSKKYGEILIFKTMYIEKKKQN